MGRRWACSATLVLVVLVSPVPAAHAAGVLIVTVNSKADTADGAIDGVCDVDTARAGRQCTLRAAIQETNAHANDPTGPDKISFRIPGNRRRVKRIQPFGSLPTASEAVVIDGYTQPGSSKNGLGRGTNAVLKIALDGRNAPSANGLTVSGASTVRGLVISNFSRGLQVSNSTPDPAVIEGNFIGTNPSGTGLDRSSNGNAITNTDTGIVTTGTTGAIIGGSSRASRNLVSGNRRNGIGTLATGTDLVQGNLVGTDRTGTKDIGNGLAGLALQSTNDITSGNVVAFNRRHGINVFHDVGHDIRDNAIFANDGPGIDLDDDGITANDTDDPDTGPNNLQNFPTINSATRASSTGQTTISGQFNSIPSASYTLRFFSNPTDTEEGQRFIGDLQVTTNAGGDVASWTFVPTQSVPAGLTITATATDAGGNTSEFSASKLVRSA